ncbi:TPA: heavy-metal-associated domain-containing protein [Burkholderia vietnamiensis]|uniref:heavy-metal-associated domain-containing protein n=1 Tax=Burkholderia cepacia complex TaxID=87882 RepID=UPI00075BE681|nr:MULTISPECIES: heavy-metal-associated domain-containing protein [Burkholderia cepacia complex]MBR8016466.1 heavy-metal-associated domain-containing protein [Burkholderia vietnamiensis]HDR9045312.1 heavy-metal-associated domain-containing protein [Burkholderia vietnamiensis]HDR9198458.1 heavy-metal-associated domain-containing protein [Burkholderia vietnamiensis]
MELEIKDMTCGHCAAAVTKAVKDVDAAAQVSVDIETKVVRIESLRKQADFLSAIQEGRLQSLSADIT